MKKWNPETQSYELSETFGSRVGGLFTISVRFLLTSYFLYLFQRMYNGDDDDMNFLTMGNDLTDGDDEIKIGESHLLANL